MKLSENFLKHYIDGSGKKLTITEEEINNSPRLLTAIKDNKKRFLESMLLGKIDNGKIKSNFKEKILALKDGETIFLTPKPSKKIMGLLLSIGIGI